MAGKEREVGIFKATPNQYNWNEYIMIKYGEVKPTLSNNEMKAKIKIIRDITKHNLDANFVGEDNYSVIVTNDKAFELLK